MNKREYNRESAIKYAEKWAYLRNPEYYNYDLIGGDCTNFASQCILAGSSVMNYNQYGWYYRNGNDKSPSWTGVEYLHNFLIHNNSIGPCAVESTLDKIENGDIIQLSFNGNVFSHTLVVVDSNNCSDLNNVFVATHTLDSYGRSVASYEYLKIRYIHITGVNY